MTGPDRPRNSRAAGEFHRLLSVDTTTPNGSVALLEDERVVGELNIASSATHSKRLLASIDFLLQAQGWRVEDLDGIAVTRGPGSFTGLRIGLSTVKALAFATGKPVAAVSSLAALADRHRDSGTALVGPMLDAKKGEIFAALFAPLRSGLKEIIPQGAYAPEEFIRRLPRRVILFAGSGVGLCRERLQAVLGKRARFSKCPEFLAADAGRLGLEILRAGRGVDADGLEPLYFRRSQAEEGR